MKERALLAMLARLAKSVLGARRGIGARIRTGMGAVAAVVSGRRIDLPLRFSTRYEVECWRNGALAWREDVCNLVVNQGLDDILDKYFKGSTYTAGWFVGLIDNTNFGDSPPAEILATDTAAKIVQVGSANPPTTNEWEEFDDYTGDRQALTLGSVSGQSVSNTASKAEFPITAGGTINGAFLVTTDTKNGTSGILYGAASFASPRVVEENDTLNVTVTLTSAAA